MAGNRVLLRDQLLVVDRGRAGHLPRLHLRVLLGHCGPEESDRADVLDRACLDDRRHETLAGVGEDGEPPVGQRHRPEEARLGVGDRLDLAGGDLVTKDVGHAGVVAAAVEVTAVGREHEALRHRLAEAVFAQRRHVTGQERFEAPHAQELVALVVADRRRKEPPVARDVEVGRHVFPGKGVDLLPLRVRVGDAHQRGQAVQMPHPQQRSIRRVEDDFADARLLEQRANLAGLHVDGLEIAQRRVVLRVERGAGARVVLANHATM